MPEGFSAVSAGCRESDGIGWYPAGLPSEALTGIRETLTDIAMCKAKPAAKPLKLANDSGVCLLLKPGRGKYWRMNYRRGGRQKTLAPGVYPAVTVADARQRREEARKLSANGVAPGGVRQQTKPIQTGAVPAQGDPLEAIARQWMARQDVAAVTANKSRRILESFLSPEIGSLAMAAITRRVLLDVQRKIKATGGSTSRWRCVREAGAG